MTTTREQAEDMVEKLELSYSYDIDDLIRLIDLARALQREEDAAFCAKWDLISGEVLAAAIRGRIK